MIISGKVWFDKNCDGIKSASDPLMSGIEVKLCSIYNEDVILDIKSTDSLGEYEFDNLKEGKYIVKFVSPKKYMFTKSNEGTNEALDSDVDGDGKSSIIILNAQNQSEVVSAGLCIKYKIAGNVFFDCNNNGLRDDGEPLIKGIVVILCKGGEEIEVSKTDCNGYYEFCELVPGNYVVKVKLLPEMNFGVQKVSSYYGSKANNSGEINISIINGSYLNAFVGVYSSSLYNDYCVNYSPNCNPCNCCECCTE